MNWFRAAVVMGALLVSGCGGGSAHHLVRTRGQIVRVGGPAPGGAVLLAGVHLRFAGTDGSASVRTGAAGRFAIELAPGTYRVTITSGGPQSDGRPMQPVPRTIHVPRSGRLRLVVNIR